MKFSHSGVLRTGELSDPARRARLAALQHHRRHPARAEGPPARRQGLQRGEKWEGATRVETEYRGEFRNT